MPFAKISEKRLAKTISIAVSGFCLYRIISCNVTDVPNALYYDLYDCSPIYGDHKSPTSTLSMFQTISMMEPSIIVNKHRFCR